MQFAPYLTLILRSPVALKRIDLRNIGLNDETAKVLVDGFKACNSLEYLSLGDNKNLTSNIVQLILKSINRSALGRLDIRGIKTTPQEQWMIKRRFNQMVKVAFDKENIEIPFPQVVVNKAEEQV